MQHTFVFLSFLFFGLSFSACKTDPKVSAGEVAKNEALDMSKPTMDTVKMPVTTEQGAKTYKITDGTLYWSGKKNAAESYTAEIKVSGGDLLVSNAFIMRGNILFDANSVNLPGDMPEAEKKQLLATLKSAKYFNSGKHPNIEYAIEGALPSSIPAFNMVLEGKLKIGEMANTLNTPAKVTFSGNDCTFESVTFGLNYSWWNMMMPGDKSVAKKAPAPATDKNAAPTPPAMVGSDGITLLLKFNAKTE